MTRFFWAFDLELAIDSANVLNDTLFSKYTERLAIAERKRDDTFRSMIYIDAMLAILISGASLTIPILGIKTSQLPAINEIVTAVSALSSIFCVTAFVNWSGYDAVVRQFSKKASIGGFLDPDFLSAAEFHFEFHQKILRRRFNLLGDDFHIPGAAFRAFSVMLTFLMALIFISIPLIHFSLIYISITNTFMHHRFETIYVLYYCMVLLSSLLAVSLAIGTYSRFEFEIREAGRHARQAAGRLGSSCLQEKTN